MIEKKSLLAAGASRQRPPANWKNYNIPANRVNNYDRMVAN